jgi:Bardet-Biedl syndrome 7 protein
MGLTIAWGCSMPNNFSCTVSRRGISSLFRIGSSKSKDKEKDKEKEKEKGSGKVVSAASNVFSGGDDGDEVARTDPLEREKKIKALQAEVAALREKVSASKESFGKLSKESVPVSTRSKVKHTLVLDETAACYKLSVESEMPIDIVALQSSLNIVVLDPGASVPSLSAPDPSNDNQLLATLRIMGTSNRISMTLMAFEGHYGTLSAYVITRVAPKVGHLVVNTIKPLSLHKIVPFQADVLEEAPMSEIKMSGSFTLGQIHSWVGSCFPDVPPKLPEGDSLRYMFKSTFLGTHVSAEYSRGEASFKSSNLSALALIKDVIAKEASLSKVKVDVKSPVINEGSVLHMLRILHPKLKELLKLKDSAKFLNALKEVSGQEENSAEFLTPEMRRLVERSEEIKAEHKDNEKRIAFIEHVLEQLFIDRFKFKGVNVKHRVSEVQALVDKYSWEALTALFSIQ